MKSLLLLSFMSLLGPIVAHGQGWLPNGTPICDSTVYSRYDFWQRMAPDGEGGAYIVWKDHRHDKPQATIFIQRISTDGQRLWNTDTISFQPDTATDYYEQGFPDIAANGKDGAYVAWQDSRMGSSYVFAQYFNPDGTQRWRQGGIQVSTKHFVEYIMMTPDGKGGALIAYGGRAAAFSFDEGLYVQRVDSAGHLLWGDGVRVRQGESRVEDGDYSIAEDGAGGCFIAWRNGTEISPAENSILAQHIDSSGSVTWGTEGKKADGNTTFMKIYTKIVSDRHGGAFVSWSQRETDPFKSYVQKLDRNGNTVLQPDSGLLFIGWSRGKMVSDDSGGVIVYHVDDTRLNWLTTKIANDGTLEWTSKVHGTGPEGREDYDSDLGFCSDGVNGVFVFWYSRLFISIYDVRDMIRAQHIDRDGRQLFGPMGIPIGGDTIKFLGRDRPTAVTTGTGEAIVSWMNNCNYGYPSIYTALYASKVTSVGLLAVSAERPIPSETSAQCYPNPGNDMVTIAFRLPHSGMATIRVSDQLGKLVHEEKVRDLAHGVNTLTVHTTHWSKGIYFVEISGNNIRMKTSFIMQ